MSECQILKKYQNVKIQNIKMSNFKSKMIKNVDKKICRM